jgi:hypothetical protein
MFEVLLFSKMVLLSIDDSFIEKGFLFRISR